MQARAPKSDTRVDCYLQPNVRMVAPQLASPPHMLSLEPPAAVSGAELWRCMQYMDYLDEYREKHPRFKAPCRHRTLFCCLLAYIEGLSTRAMLTAVLR